MPVTNYFAVNGKIIGESTNGVRTDYLTDALGSITATVDNHGNVLNTYRYKPYGGLLSKTGTAPDPRFMWTGNTGSRTTKAPGAEQYNRARHYGTTQAQWTTRDPMWPNERSYGYCFGDPITATDPFGLACIDSSCCCCAWAIGLQNQKTLINYTGPISGKGCTSEFDGATGVYYEFAVLWGAVVSGTPPPAHMPACRLSWDELSTKESGDTGIVDKMKEGFCSNKIWSLCQPKATNCGLGACGFWDFPNVMPLTHILGLMSLHKKPFHTDICIFISLHSSCSTGPCAGHSVELNLKFSLDIDWPYSGKSSIHPVLKKSDDNCKVREGWFDI